MGGKMAGEVNRDRLIDLFVAYTRIDTKSDSNNAGKAPSTQGQFELAKIVAEDLKKAGYRDIELTKECNLFATLPENLPEGSQAGGKVPVIGLLSHFDTASEAPGANVKVCFHKNYQGGEIKFSGNPDLRLAPENSPHLNACVGHTIITSDGTTLLGGDDKAGIAVLVELGNYYRENPDILHGKLRVAVISDEEIGVGTERLDLKKFGADVAYTIDGGMMGEIDVESFNGFMGKINVEGYAAFPGYGKGMYVNAIQVLSKIIAKMEENRWPQNCDGRQQIWWIQEFKGEVARADAAVYLRDFDLEGIEKMKERMEEIKTEVLKEHPKAKVAIDIQKTYLNYKYELEKDPRVVNYAKEAMEKIGIKPRANFVRGGNDSCHLCFSGLLSTNLFIGMQNMHSFMEWNTVETIEAALKTVVSLANVWVEHSTK